jgi:hypothetical protein
VDIAAGRRTGKVEWPIVRAINRLLATSPALKEWATARMVMVGHRVETRRHHCLLVDVWTLSIRDAVGSQMLELGLPKRVLNWLEEFQGSFPSNLDKPFPSRPVEAFAFELNIPRWRKIELMKS